MYMISYYFSLLARTEEVVRQEKNSHFNLEYSKVMLEMQYFGAFITEPQLWKANVFHQTTTG